MGRKITVAEMAPHIHSFLPNENKVKKLADWLANWIEISLEAEKIKPYDFLPSKGDLACHIGVSQGTVQNAYRLVEDLGLIESKQRLGTFIKSRVSVTTKLTSKRELAVEIVKRYLLESGYEIGDKIISIRNLSQILKISNTTLIAAATTLTNLGILDKQKNAFYLKSLNFEVKKIESQTLVKKIAEIIKISLKDFNSGDKIPSNAQLANQFGVSTKTIHDSIKLLIKEGVLQTKRGRYGTCLAEENPELYSYEKIEQTIRHYIHENSQVGDKLPSIKEFAKLYNTSEKTVKKAFDNLVAEGYLTSTRGRYGGTFVMDIPQAANEAYKWLALNSEYILPN